MSQNRRQLGLCPRPYWRSLKRSPDPWDGFTKKPPRKTMKNGKLNETEEGKWGEGWGGTWSTVDRRPWSEWFSRLSVGGCLLILCCWSVVKQYICLLCLMRVCVCMYVCVFLLLLCTLCKLLHTLHKTIPRSGPDLNACIHSRRV